MPSFWVRFRSIRSLTLRKKREEKNRFDARFLFLFRFIPGFFETYVFRFNELGQPEKNWSSNFSLSVIKTGVQLQKLWTRNSEFSNSSRVQPNSRGYFYPSESVAEFISNPSRLPLPKDPFNYFCFQFQLRALFRIVYPPRPSEGPLNYWILTAY